MTFCKFIQFRVREGAFRCVVLLFIGLNFKSLLFIYLIYVVSL